MRANRKVRGFAISLARKPVHANLVSWWIGKDRQQFTEAAKQEEARMRATRLHAKTSGL